MTALKNTLKIFASLILFLVLSACQPQDEFHIPPTDAFYINDYADALLNATEWTILEYSLELYEDSKTQEYANIGISGSQVVVLTYVGNVGDFDVTELFNSWEIGENNMGLLLILFFEQSGEELVYKEQVPVFGSKMMEYLTAFELSNMIEQYFYDPAIPSYDYDLKLISLYFAILEFIYTNIYQYSTYNYDSFIEEYLDNQYEYFGPLPSYDGGLFEELPVWAWILIIVVVILFGGNIFPFLLFGGRGGIRFRGGGGKSIGYWFRK
ncbi:MAG TPA: hypothetical protein PLR26_03965 [Bacilli bacterium]|nr:hypothetical protein [Bacilli bacterium]